MLYYSLAPQVYLGGFDTEIAAARAFDILSLKCRGPKAETNFSLEEYGGIVNQIESMTKDALLGLLRRRSKGFARGTSRSVVLESRRGWLGEEECGSGCLFQAKLALFSMCYYIYIYIYMYVSNISDIAE